MKLRSTAALAALCSLLLASTACDSRQSGALKDLLYLEQPGYEGQEISEERINELKSSIDRFRAKVNEKVEAAGQLGEYYKMLASAYIDRKMYGLALDTLEEAVRIEPENPRLFYLAGVAGGRTAKALVGAPEEQEQMFQDAEAYYERAIELSPNYTDALYGLSVLYVFELDRAADAIPLLEKLVERQQQNARALSVLARAYAATGRRALAAETYVRAAEASNDAQLREQARSNQEQLMQDAAEGSQQ